jgi:hypothetical protein
MEDATYSLSREQEEFEELDCDTDDDEDDNDISQRYDVDWNVLKNIKVRITFEMNTRAPVVVSDG